MTTENEMISHLHPKITKMHVDLSNTIYKIDNYIRSIGYFGWVFQPLRHIRVLRQVAKELDIIKRQL